MAGLAEVMTIAMALVVLGMATADETPVSCGAASVWILLAEHGKDVALEEMAARLPVRKDGQSVAELVAAGNERSVPLVAEMAFWLSNMDGLMNRVWPDVVPLMVPLLVMVEVALLVSWP